MKQRDTPGGPYREEFRTGNARDQGRLALIVAFLHDVTQRRSTIELIALNNQLLYSGRTAKDGFYAGRSDSNGICITSFEVRYEKVKGDKARTVKILITQECPSVSRNKCKAEYKGSGLKQ